MRRTCQPFSVNTAVSFSCDCQPSFAPESQLATPVAIAGNAAADATNDRMAKTANFMNPPWFSLRLVSSILVSLRRERVVFKPIRQGVRRRFAEGYLRKT